MYSSVLHRKMLTVLATIDVIHEMGFLGLSTKEIAKRQGISEGTLFRHFRSKTDILLAVLDYFSQFDHDIFETIQSNNMKPEEAILYFTRAYGEYYENYPAITAITQAYDLLSYEPPLQDKITSIIGYRNMQISKCIEQAQKNGVFTRKMNSSHAADIIMGSIRSICFTWRLEKYSFPLKQRMLDTVSMLLRAFQPDPQDTCS